MQAPVSPACCTVVLASFEGDGVASPAAHLALMSMHEGPGDLCSPIISCLKLLHPVQVESGSCPSSQQPQMTQRRIRTGESGRLLTGMACDEAVRHQPADPFMQV